MNSLSVCMATRNGERYIGEQLASILRQIGPEDEVVISDDSSTDGTLEVIRSFADPRIRLYPDNTFYSPIANLENALKRAGGEIIALADQDDVWLDNKTRLIREKLQAQGEKPKVKGPRSKVQGDSRFTDHRSPITVHGIKLVALDAEIVDEEGRVAAGSLFDRNGAGPGLLKNIYDNTYTGCTMAFTRPLLDVALPFPAGIPMHDSWLGLLAELFGEVEFVRQATMRYRRHGKNVSRRLPLHRQIGGRLCLAWHLARRRIRES